MRIDQHPLVRASAKTFAAANDGLDVALEYLSSSNTDDHARMRVALGGLAAACDALKGAANAWSNTLGQATRDREVDGKWDAPLASADTEKGGGP